ncbi:MAG: DUF4278 domain-containing protein [Leptolyngbyaceae cyanobacterium]
MVSLSATGFYSNRFHFNNDRDSIQHTNTTENTLMSLIYRGQSTQPSATSETVETGMTGTFMGRSYAIRKSLQPAQRNTPTLQYRGTLY